MEKPINFQIGYLILHVKVIKIVDALPKTDCWKTYWRSTDKSRNILWCKLRRRLVVLNPDLTLPIK